MADDTRTRLIETAADLFAEKGFDGTSIAAIAGPLGLTKQALLHHFGTKERLYGAILQDISGRMMADLDRARADNAAPADQLRSYFLNFHRWAVASPRDARLLMRELLDNQGRAERAGAWYLKPYLQALARLVLDLPAWSDRSEAEALACVYHLLGGIKYLAISRPTLASMFGADRFDDLTVAHEAELVALLDARLGA